VRIDLLRAIAIKISALFSMQYVDQARTTKTKTEHPRRRRRRPTTFENKQAAEGRSSKPHDIENMKRIMQIRGEFWSRESWWTGKIDEVEKRIDVSRTTQTKESSSIVLDRSFCSSTPQEWHRRPASSLRREKPRATLAAGANCCRTCPSPFRLTRPRTDKLK